MGQLFMMGWEGDSITPQIRTLITDYGLGSIILTAKNLKSAADTARLCQELQQIARDAGHPVPLLIAVDQENGGVNSLYDEDYICQYPSAMGLAASGSPDLAYEVAKATATEISAVGVNLILGPVLDVMNNAQLQPMGVRASGDDPHECSTYGIASMNGYKAAGLTTCGKHFPSYGNLTFVGSTLDIPIITETLDQLRLSALVPFRDAINAGIDAIMVGGCAINNSDMNIMHACLSQQVVDDLLRRDLGFDGVVISECLEMESLSHDIGFRGGCVMAIEAGCDLVLLCRSFSVQKEAWSGLKIGLDNGMVSSDRIKTSLRRVLKLKASCTSWEKALNPPGLKLLSNLRDSHLNLSTRAYDASITVMRDNNHVLPLSQTMSQSDELLLLTPLLKPLPASAATKFLSEGKPIGIDHDRWMDRSSIMSGEGVFRELGRQLARERHGKLLHTSYTAHGVRPAHEHLIERASTIIIITADANRNLYQSGFAKHVNMMCSLASATGKKKTLITVAVSSPYDFVRDKSIGTYICTYDFTETAMQALVRVLFGHFTPQGTLPGILRRSTKVQKSRQTWLVEPYTSGDYRALDKLILAVSAATLVGVTSPLAGATAASFNISDPSVSENHYVVRNSSTGALFGFCATYTSGDFAHIGALFVDPQKRNLSVGHSLFQRALRALGSKPDVAKIRIGVQLPSIFPGVLNLDSHASRFQRWLTATFPAAAHNTVAQGYSSISIPDLSIWSPPEGVVKTVQRLPVDFDLIHGSSSLDDEMATHLTTHGGWEALKMYRLALDDVEACGVVRAKSRADGRLVGTVIIARSSTSLQRWVPCLVPRSGRNVGGALTPVVNRGWENAAILMQGLLLLGCRQNKAHLATESFVDLVSCFLWQS
jgi:beta-N-acetylhexosaminidase